MPGQYSQLRLALTAAILLAIAAPALSKRYPSPRDEEYSFHSICELYYVDKRVPVYRTPVASGPPLFYMPKNYGVCISGASNGWAIFGRIREAAHFRAFWELVPDQGVDYGWIRFSDLKPGSRDEACTLRRKSAGGDLFEFPGAGSELASDLCPTTFETTYGANVVVMFYQRPYVGKTYRSLAPASLNTCTKTCRDDRKCQGFSYAISANRCELKSGGGIDFEHWDHETILTGAKLAD